MSREVDLALTEERSRLARLLPCWRLSRYTAAEICLVALVIVGASALRIGYLDTNPFWVDEAESSINALTILKNGYPTDSYLGLPIYENTLVQTWPGNCEYEFRDISYSENHFAIYHGWLPLYAIAGSLAIQGIRPDEADGRLSTKHDLSDRKRRTRAARLPSVLFAAAFLLIAFAGGKILYGRDAAWTALLLGSIHPWHLYISHQARYYSAQVALTTACCILLWLLIKDCTWKLTFLAALGFVLLFYTHLLSFFTGVLLFLLVLPLIVRHREGAIRKMMVFAGLLAAGTLPWVIVTGFYAHQSHIPRAWSLLQLPGDFLNYPPLTLSNALVGTVVVLLLGFIFLAKRKISPRFRAPAEKLAPILCFLGMWGAVAYAAFLLFMPAVSFATDRMNLSYWGPWFLLESVICACVARMIMPRFSIFLAPAVMFLIFIAGGNSLRFGPSHSNRTWQSDGLILTQIDAMHLKSTTKLFAAPNNHLILTFYSGLPIQDMTPVRKSYLNAYKHEIVYIDMGMSVDTGALAPEHIRQVALNDGHTLSRDAADQWSERLGTRDYRAAMLNILPGTVTPLEALPPFARKLMYLQHREASSMFANAGLGLVTRGFDIRTWSDWRAVLKYRFVDIGARSGIRANYAERLREAEAITLPEADTVIYRSQWHPTEFAEGQVAITHAIRPGASKSAPN